MAKISSRGEALRLHQQGWTVPRIARELGVKEDSVRRSLERAGVQLRRAGVQAASRNAPSREDRAEALAAVVPVLDRFHRLAGAIRELAAEYLFDHFNEPAAQELMLAARRVKEDAGDCLFYGRLSLHADPVETDLESSAAKQDLETVRAAIRLLAATGRSRDKSLCPKAASSSAPAGGIG